MEHFNQQSTLFHIPHSRTSIPDYTGFIVSKINNEIQLLTDFATEDIFQVPSVESIVFPYSRIFCDVERLPDDQEIMFKSGRGFFYTHTDSGELLRVDSDNIKQHIWKAYYMPHHKRLTAMTQDKLNKHGVVTIIDCHSFADVPFQSDLVQTKERPDICIGTDEFHTPQYLVELISEKALNLGFSCEVNSPYSGTIVPSEFYKRNNKVQSIMIEINRKLYMNQGVVNYESVHFLNDFVRTVFET